MLGALSATTALFVYKIHSCYQESQREKRKIPPELRGSYYEKELETAVEVAYECGSKMLLVIDDLEKKKIDKSEGNESSIADWVTETDRSNEALIFKALRMNFPTYHFIGEEMSSDEGIPELTNDPTWIVDPVDGTTNFVHSFPLTCVSIGLCINKRPVLGVVYCGSTQELFLAIRGKGSFLNGKRLTTSKASTLSDSLILTEFGYGREPKDLDRIFRVMRSLLLNGVQGFRQMGSGVLDLW